MSTTNPLPPSSVIPFPSSPSPAPVLFGAVLKEHRKKNRLTQQDFAEALHVTRNTVINWEADKSKPDYDLIPEICALLGIRLYELFRMEAENNLTEQEDRILRNIRSLKPSTRKALDKMIDTLMTEELLQKDEELKNTYELIARRPGMTAAGMGAFVPAEPPKCTFLRRNRISTRADGIVRVTGRSMEPAYLDGSDVYYREASSACPGQDVIVDTDDGAVIKRVADDYTLFSVNPDPDLAYPAKSDQNTVLIRGIVLGTVSPSDYPAKEDLPLLEELFADEIRDFNETYHTSDYWD